MNVGIVNYSNGVTAENNRIITPSGNVNPPATEPKMADNQELPWGLVHLSKESWARYGYWRKFCDFFNEEEAPTQPLSQDESVFSRFAGVYLDSKTEIMKNYSGDLQKTHLQLLENAANDAAESFCDSLARSFTYFFNYGPDVYRNRLGMEIEAVFDKKVFLERLTSASHETLKNANKALDRADAVTQIEAYLANNTDNSGIENMSFNDITILTRCLKKTNDKSATLGDFIRGRAENWNEAIDKYSEYFSPNIRNLMKTTAAKNLRIASLEADYVTSHNKYTLNLDDLFKQISKLNMSRITLLKQLENNSDFSAKFRIKLEARMAFLKARIQDYSKAVEDLKKDQAETQKDFLGKLEVQYLEDAKVTNGESPFF